MSEDLRKTTAIYVMEEHTISPKYDMALFGQYIKTVFNYHGIRWVKSLITNMAWWSHVSKICYTLQGNITVSE